MNVAKDPATLLPASTLNLRPLLLANMACTMSMMAFVALIGPIARQLGMATWQAGAAVTVAGVVWVLLARPWGRAADRLGRRRILLLGSAGFTLAYWLLCLFVEGALRWMPGATLAFIGLMIARGCIGAFYAAIPVGCNALIADHVEPQRRARAMASLGAANAVGLVVGPALAALLARHSLSLPFHIMSLLPATAFLVLFFTLKPQALPHSHAPSPVRLNDTRLRRPLLVAFSAEDDPGRCHGIGTGLCLWLAGHHGPLAVGLLFCCGGRHGLRLPGVFGTGGQCHAGLRTRRHGRLHWRRPRHGRGDRAARRYLGVCP